jgi:hypothetical protein
VQLPLASRRFCSLTPGAGLVLSAGWWLCAVGRPANQCPYNKRRRPRNFVIRRAGCSGRRARRGCREKGSSFSELARRPCSLSSASLEGGGVVSHRPLIAPQAQKIWRFSLRFRADVPSRFTNQLCSSRPGCVMYARRIRRNLRRSSIPSNAGPGSLQPMDPHVMLAKHPTTGNKKRCDGMGSICALIARILSPRSRR